MSEVNARWERDFRFAKRLTIMGCVVCPILWLVSYQVSFGAGGENFHGIWMGLTSLATLLAAFGVTIASGVGLTIVFADEPPLEGSNR